MTLSKLVKKTIVVVSTAIAFIPGLTLAQSKQSNLQNIVIEQNKKSYIATISTLSTQVEEQYDTKKLSQAPRGQTLYTKLENLLRYQKFKEADLETYRIMLAITERQQQGWLRVEDANSFPCKELRKIDNLWLKYSKSKFGISVQQRIYKNLGKTEQFNASVWRQFGNKVGWIKSSSWLDYNKLNFSVNAPAGHLPIILISRWERGWVGFFPSPQTCKV